MSTNDRPRVDVSPFAERVHARIRELEAQGICPVAFSFQHMHDVTEQAVAVRAMFGTDDAVTEVFYPPHFEELEPKQWVDYILIAVNQTLEVMSKRKFH